MRSNSIPSLLALLAGLSSVHALVNVYVQNKCPYDMSVVSLFFLSPHWALADRGRHGPDSYPVAHNTELTEVYKGYAGRQCGR
jgi:hypothetical protein